MPKNITYDRDEVLNRAMLQFWRSGYEATSVQDLVDVTGINRASIYNSFGDKKGLFLAAVEHYLETVNRKRLKILQADGPALPAIEAFFSDLLEFSHKDGRQLGCLITNSLVELAPLDVEMGNHLRSILDRVEDNFYTTLLRAQSQGELAAGQDLRALARFLTGQVQGLRVLARADSESGRIDDMVSVAMKVLRAA